MLTFLPKILESLSIHTRRIIFLGMDRGQLHRFSFLGSTEATLLAPRAADHLAAVWQKLQSAVLQLNPSLKESTRGQEQWWGRGSKRLKWDGSGVLSGTAYAWCALSNNSEPYPLPMKGSLQLLWALVVLYLLLSPDESFPTLGLYLGFICFPKPDRACKEHSCSAPHFPPLQLSLLLQKYLNKNE